MLAGCAGQNELFHTNENPFPTTYKSEILAFLRTYLNDPTNIKNASVTQPISHRLGPEQRYIVCVRFNAKNSDGKYAGVIDTAALFKEGKLYRFLPLIGDATSPDAQIRTQLTGICKSATYQPFPELEHLSIPRS